MSTFDASKVYQISNVSNQSQTLGVHGTLHPVAGDARQTIVLGGSELQKVEHLLGEGIYKVEQWSEEAGSWIAHEAESLFEHNKQQINQAETTIANAGSAAVAEGTSVANHNTGLINQTGTVIENVGSTIANEGSVIAAHNTGIINQTGTIIENTGTAVENTGSAAANFGSTGTKA